MSVTLRPATRARVARRALVGAAWTLAWTLVWGCMLMMFASRAHAAPLGGDAITFASPRVYTQHFQSLVTTSRAGGLRAGIDVLRAIDPVPLHRVDAAAVGLVQ